jgi:alpha-tubulin suppressor-like RCC1 family protein
MATKNGDEDEDSKRKKQTGVVYGWGWSASGQLGTVREKIAEPTAVGALSTAEARVALVAAGLAHTAAVSDTGELMTCGKAAHGRLGRGAATTDIGLVGPVLGIPRRVVRVACGGFHTAVLSSAREVYTFGRNDQGQLGVGGTEPSSSVPRLVDRLSGKHAMLVACGGAHTLVAVESGAVYAFGSNDHGQVGNGSASAMESLPVIALEVPAAAAGMASSPDVGEELDLGGLGACSVVGLSAGSAHSAAVRMGRVYTWGANVKGQCGHGHYDPQIRRPHEISAGPLSQQSVVSIACGLEHTAAVTESGQVFTWGSEEHSQGGHGALSTIDAVAAGAISAASAVGAGGAVMANAEPCRVKEALLKQRCVAVRCGSYHTLAITTAGDLYVWGLGDLGQLGHGSTSNLPAPFHLRGVLQGAKISDVACGGRHTLVACSPAPIIRIPPSRYAEDIGHALNNAELSDVKLVTTDGQEIPAHRIVLARSEVLRHAFRSGAAKDGRLTLDGIDFATVMPLLEFLYCCTVTITVDANPTAREVALLAAAEKLGLFQLVKAFQEHMPGCTAAAARPGTAHAIPINDTDSITRMRLFQMKSFLNSTELSDVVLVLRDDEGTEERFPAHRFVLAYRSEVLRSMIAGHFKESTEREISLPMHRPSAFRTLLQYLYSDKADLTEDDAVEVLMMSNEYGLEQLKAQCEDFIQQSIDIDNVAWLFEISERNSARQLRAFCEYFMLNKLPEVAQTEGYKNLSEDIKAMLARGHVVPHQPGRKDGKCNMQ